MWLVLCFPFDLSVTLLCRNPHSRLQGVKWGQRPRSPLLDTQPVRGRRSLNPNPGQCIHLILSPCRTLWPHGLLTARLLCSWDLPGKNTGVGCHFLLQEFFLPRDRICISCTSCVGRQILYHWTTWEVPMPVVCIHVFFCLFLSN